MLHLRQTRKAALIALIVASCALQPAIANCPANANITTPSGSPTYSDTANIACNGNGNPDMSTFTISVVDGNLTVLQSANATISGGGWSATLNAPSGGWPAASTLYLDGVCGSTAYFFHTIFTR
jgi:hypothetical protein